MAEKEYIERGSLMRYVEKQEVIIKGGTSIADAMRIQGNVFRRCAETCPAADVVEVRHGCWIDNHNGTFTCSVCGGRASKMAWCGHCGAKMDRKEDEGK
jgi:hypothetical protein